ncbi:HNH endonuclease [Clostridium estertheticum]|uniref:HNH endonuclease n=1 Tax=Clostridium estertheticum TaxID=238834 RepID=UPI001C7D0006|nr:HNH endonuclease [Clostridium estertheticum]MBX4263770.1 HNH endonuclease [Clostridium estertheticum]WLC87584.1 HNH endonuclease [Clostridium estertheticum]
MMRKFRDFRIIRTCTKKYTVYGTYKPSLRKDFKGRCSYCNLLENSITTPFEVDHYIPRDTFKDDWPELDTLYENLVFACKKCNIAKSSKYTGNISNKRVINEEFYNPVDVDYGTIFYRNDAGGIDSYDAKGKDMIAKLKLYKPIHNMAWICENLNATLEKIDIQIEKSYKNPLKREILKKAKDELNDYYRLCNKLFQSNYNNDKFNIPESNK